MKYDVFSCAELGYLLEEMVRKNEKEMTEDAKDLILTSAIGLYNHDIIQKELVEMSQSLIFVVDTNRELLKKLESEQKDY